MKLPLAALCGLVALTCVGCFQHPSDEAFRRLFTQKRTAFADVADAVDASGITGYVVPEQHAKIVVQYGSSLLQDDDFHLVRRDDGAVLFGFSAHGLSIAGTRKGIARVPAKSLKFYKLLSSDSLWHREEGDYLKPIEGDWYIYVIN